MKIWIESDLLGNRSIMIQPPIEGALPVKHCTFHYHSITDNATTLAAAESMARSLGAKGVIENINIGLKYYDSK